MGTTGEEGKELEKWLTDKGDTAEINAFFSPTTSPPQRPHTDDDFTRSLLPTDAMEAENRNVWQSQ